MRSTQSPADVIAAVLREEPGAMDALSAFEATDILTAAEHHGVTALLQRALGTVMPPALAGRLDWMVKADAVRGEWRRRQFCRVVGAFADAGIGALVLKGDALAFTHYEAPYLRPRLDSDVLVRKTDLTRAMAMLRAIGYHAGTMVYREMVHTQRSFEYRDRSQVHYVDLHWAISSRPLFAAMATFDDLARDSRPVDALGESTRTPSPVWSLLVACIHRVAHHDDTDRLIWLVDIKLLSERLSSEEWGLFWALAAQREIVDVCRTGLELSATKLGCSQRVRDAIAARPVPHPWKPEPASAFLGGGLTQLKVIALDAKAVPGFRAKARLLASHLFPDAEYMREAFGATSKTGLVAAYVRRAVGGFRKSVS